MVGKFAVTWVKVIKRLKIDAIPDLKKAQSGFTKAHSKVVIVDRDHDIHSMKAPNGYEQILVLREAYNLVHKFRNVEIYVLDRTEWQDFT